MIAEIEVLQRTVDNLRAFADSHPGGEPLSQEDCKVSILKLAALFGPNFAASLLWLAEHGYSLSADHLRNRRREFMSKARHHLPKNEPSLNIQSSHNLLMDIRNLAEEIEKVVTAIGGGSEQVQSRQAQPTDLKNLEIAGSTLNVSRSWLQNCISEGKLTSYRRDKKGPHLVSMAEATALASPRRPE